MAPEIRRPTPPPPPDVCHHHSGYSARIHDLEGRAIAASGERREIVKELTELRVTMARWIGALGVSLAAVQIAVAFAVKLLP